MSTDRWLRGLSVAGLTTLLVLASSPALHAVRPGPLVGARDLAIAAPRSVGSPGDTRPDLGCGAAEVTRTLRSGSAWRMCARVHPFKGLVLEQVQFQPATGDREHLGWMPVLDSLYLAQLNVPYDSGAAAFNDITGYGFGNDQLLTQNSDTCSTTPLPVEQAFLRGTQWVERTVPGICVTEVSTGLAWHSQEGYRTGAERHAQDGRALELSSLSKISWYEYQQKFTLTDQGTIRIGLGATGDLAPGALYFPNDPAVGWPISPAQDDTEAHATSHWHNASYRVDFGIGTGAQQVQQWDYRLPDPTRPIRVEGAATTHTSAFSAPHDTDPQTWWRVVNPTSLNPDGHARSYEIVNDSIQNPHHADTSAKVSFTNDHACQEYASDNLNAACPGLDVPDYVAAENEPLTDPVAWVNVGFHHIDRDEDQSPMPSHWQEFSLVPRDLLSQQAVTPIERSCVNGPVSATGSCAAVNTSLPKVRSSTSVVGPGTLLTATPGSWRAARAPMRYQYLWLRDGHPIRVVGADGLSTNASGTTFRVSAADVGHRLSARVIAWGDGVLAGSAESSKLPVPPSPVPGPSVTASPRQAPRITASVSGPRGGRLQIRVHGTRGVATGVVRVRARGWTRRIPLTRGKARVQLPHAWRGKRVLISMRYLGGPRYTPRTARIRVTGKHFRG